MLVLHRCRINKNNTHRNPTSSKGAVYVLTDSGGGVISDQTPPTSKLIKLTPR
jgi:hypothetical protein